MNKFDVLKIFRSIRWTNRVYCPRCNSFHVHSKGVWGKSTRYQCPECGNNFSDFTDTPFEHIKIPFRKILYIFVHIRTKIINQLAKEVKFHINTVGRYHKRIHEYLLENHDSPSFNSEIEIDEVYIIAGEKGIKNPVMDSPLEKEL